MILDKAFLCRFDKNISGKFSYLPSILPSMRVQRTDHLVLIDSDLPCDMFNILCCDGPLEISVFRGGIEYFKSKNLAYAFWVGFENEPLWLELELQKLGLITDETEWAMVCDLSHQKAIHAERFFVERVSHQKGIADLLHVMKQIFPQHEHAAIQSFYDQSTASLISSSSQLVYFVGYEHEIPISLVSVYFDAGLASIFDVIVAPEMRGRGWGKRMTQQAMIEAKTRGFDQCILTATNDAKYLYQKLGFIDVKTMKVYTRSTSPFGCD